MSDEDGAPSDELELAEEIATAATEELPAGVTLDELVDEAADYWSTEADEDEVN